MNNEDTIKDLHLYEDEETIQNLELHNPENANHEYAVGFLKFMQRFAHVASKTEGFDMDDFLDRYKKSSK
jgi:hypothetical protein